MWDNVHTIWVHAPLVLDIIRRTVTIVAIIIASNKASKIVTVI